MAPAGLVPPGASAALSSSFRGGPRSSAQSPVALFPASAIISPAASCPPWVPTAFSPRARHAPRRGPQPSLRLLLTPPRLQPKPHGCDLRGLTPRGHVCKSLPPPETFLRDPGLVRPAAFRTPAPGVLERTTKAPLLAIWGLLPKCTLDLLPCFLAKGPYFPNNGYKLLNISCRASGVHFS